MMHDKQSRAEDRVLVVGGGLGGVRAAFDLAEAGRKAVLVDSAPSLGGLMSQLDRTFPTDNCDVCSMLPRLSANGNGELIELETLTQATSLKGEAGNFTVSLTTSPRYVDLDKCTGCGECLRKFPECVNFTPGLNFRSTTCMRYPQAAPQAFSINMDQCADVGALVECCPANAIVPDDAVRTREEVFGAIILAPGAQVFDPSGITALGYGQHPDIVTSLEYERILSAAGPTQGQLVRPSDGKQPSKIAWLQCVGSRGRCENLVPYCSSACCMFALKETVVTKERFQDDIEACIFFMDMRASGKDYEVYYQRARNGFGVRFVRCRTQNIISNSKTNRLSVTYWPDGGDTVASEDFDMVVLSTGFRIADGVRTLADTMGVAIDAHGFAQTDNFSPVTTSRPGVYVCGLFEGPKDIGETITQASAAACLASGHVAPSDAETSAIHNLPPERDISGEEPRVGVYIWDCGGDIAKTVDVRKLAGDIGALPQVETAEVVGQARANEYEKLIGKMIEEKRINRLVIAGGSPRTLKPQFADLLVRSGLNKQLLEIANVREQVAWVHQGCPKEATEKAGELIRMAIAGAIAAHPVAEVPLHINKDVLVVGGGVAGMTAALSLAEQGVKVHLLEQSDALGGVAKNIRRTVEGEDVQALVEGLMLRTEWNENIEVTKNAAIVDHSGIPGMFKTGFRGGPQADHRQVEHGVTILATGALADRPALYFLDEHEAVRTQGDADNFIEDHPEEVKEWDKIVMIQCVGSRCPENPNCSQVCCQSAIKNALRILDLNPEARIFVLYRDMRTVGLQEDAYREARARGVIFVHYNDDHMPQVSTAGEQLRVVFHDPILNDELAVNADQLLLSTGFAVNKESNRELASIFGLLRTEDGSFKEDHVKFRPVALSKPGFFVAGTALGPRTIRQSIAQGQAAAARAQALLLKDVIYANAAVAHVEEEKCASCLTCVRSCPYGVPFLNSDGYAQIDATLCRGCGVCAAVCPGKAIQFMSLEDDRIMAKLDGLLKEGAIA